MFFIFDTLYMQPIGLPLVEVRHIREDTKVSIFPHKELDAIREKCDTSLNFFLSMHGIDNEVNLFIHIIFKLLCTHKS